MVTIRKAVTSDAEEFSKFMVMSAPYFLKLFGEKIEIVLQHLFCEHSNLFSFEHTYFMEVNGKKAGMLLSYDWKIKKQENVRTGLLLFKFLRFNMPRKIWMLIKFNQKIGNLPKDTYYISNLAVHPEFRGKGLSKKLMNFAENKARNKKVRILILDVEQENITAVNLYKKLGYNILEKLTINSFKDEQLNFFRMVKKVK